MDSIEEAEARLRAADIPANRWLYISANADYAPETPVSHRLGGKRWPLKDLE
jgi:hypothetical protein